MIERLLWVAVPLHIIKDHYVASKILVVAGLNLFTYQQHFYRLTLSFLKAKLSYYISGKLLPLEQKECFGIMRCVLLLSFLWYNVQVSSNPINK